MDDGIELVCPTEEGGEAGTTGFVGANRFMVRFAFKGRDSEDVRLLDVRGPEVFRAAVDREPEGKLSLAIVHTLAFRLRRGREAEDEQMTGDDLVVTFRFAIGR